MAYGEDSAPLAVRKMTLPPELRSVSAARRMVRELLREADRQQWRDAAELAISEVVTNAVLHAHTPVEIAIQVRPDRMSAEVRDASPVLPAQRSYDQQATTGRGMSLVAAVTLECGVSSLGDDGKLVWFSVGDDQGEPTEWEVDAADGRVATGGRVVLQNMPPTLWLAARQHHDALLRELTLYQAAHPGSTHDLAAADRARNRLLAAVLEALAQRGERGNDGSARAAGIATETPEMDVELLVPAGSGAEFVTLQGALDAAEDLAVAGRLFVVPGLPEIVAVRDWACEQVIAQLAGVPPQPWAGADQERFTTEVRGREDPEGAEWDPRVVTDSELGLAASDEANRIVAVSRRLAENLGWTVEELVGRRVVTLIPPRLREAHVAAFSRHVTTGEAKVLGVDLELPVLHRDGSEVPCSFRVERAPVTRGRPIFVAAIEPLGDTARD